MEMETKQCVNLDRRGIFKVADQFVRTTPLDVLARFFSKFIITRCEYLYNSRTFVYEAFCEEFDKVDVGFESPEYEVSLGKSGFEITKKQLA